MLSLGDNIRAKRNALGMTADDLATRLGISRATIYRYESSDADNMPISILTPLAAALNTTPADLMGWGSEDHEFKPTVSFDDKETMHMLSQAYLRHPKPVQDEIIKRLGNLDFTFSKNTSRLLSESGDINGFMSNTGLSFATVGKLMQGETVQTTPEEAERIADYFHTDIVGMFFDEISLPSDFNSIDSFVEPLRKECAYTIAEQLPQAIAGVLRHELDSRTKYSDIAYKSLIALVEYLSQRAASKEKLSYKRVKLVIGIIQEPLFSDILRRTLKKFNKKHAGAATPDIIAAIIVKRAYELSIMFRKIYLNSETPVGTLMDEIESSLNLNK